MDAGRLGGCETGLCDGNHAGGADSHSLSLRPCESRDPQPQFSREHTKNRELIRAHLSGATSPLFHAAVAIVPGAPPRLTSPGRAVARHEFAHATPVEQDRTRANRRHQVGAKGERKMRPRKIINVNTVFAEPMHHPVGEMIDDQKRHEHTRDIPRLAFQQIDRKRAVAPLRERFEIGVRHPLAHDHARQGVGGILQDVACHWRVETSETSLAAHLAEAMRGSQ